jgi:HK97 family phage prohead protease
MDGMPTIIGSADTVEIENEALVFQMRFATTDIAKAWQSLYEDGHAKAFSVGFIPMEGGWKEQGDESVYVHTRVELLEISAVAVPANPEAVTRGIDPDEINKLVDARVKQLMQQWAAKRLQAAIEGI